MGPLFALAPAIGGVISSVVNAIHAHSQQEKQNAFNVSMIDKQNQYNSPEAIINRMVTAGIPLKAAQKSLAGVPTAGEQTNVASSAPNNFDAAQSFANVYLAMAQAQNLKADAILKSEDARGKQIDNQNKQSTYDDSHSLALETIEKSKADRAKTKSDIDVNQSVINLSRKQERQLDLLIEHGEIENSHYAEILDTQQRIAAANADMSEKDAAFAIATYDSRVSRESLENASLKADTKHVVEATREIMQTLNINAPEEKKAELLESLYERSPTALKVGILLFGAGKKGVKAAVRTATRTISQAGKFIK